MTTITVLSTWDAAAIERSREHERAATTRKDCIHGSDFFLGGVVVSMLILFETRTASMGCVGKDKFSIEAIFIGVIVASSGILHQLGL